MDKKFKIEFDEANVQDSVAYILVTEFDLKPNVLKAEISGDGSGVMILALEGDEAKLEAAEKRLKEAGFNVSTTKRIERDEDLCWDCGACVSLCPAYCFSHDKETMKVVLDNSKCIACGACVNSCSVHALRLHL
jgi:NAD-dependent dihydropyrimidine dehydrogenase PreA subunit